MKENQKSKYLIKVGNHSNLKFLCERWEGACFLGEVDYDDTKNGKHNPQ